MEGYYAGFVSDVDAQGGKVKVVYPQEEDTISEWLPLLAFEYNPPRVGDFVATVLGKNLDGVCLGKIFSAAQAPKELSEYTKYICADVKITKNNGVFAVDFSNGASISYDGTVLTVKATQIKLDGNVTQ